MKIIGNLIVCIFNGKTFVNKTKIIWNCQGKLKQHAFQQYILYNKKLCSFSITKVSNSDDNDEGCRDQRNFSDNSCLDFLEI